MALSDVRGMLYLEERASVIRWPTLHVYPWSGRLREHAIERFWDGCSDKD